MRRVLPAFLILLSACGPTPGPVANLRPLTTTQTTLHLSAVTPCAGGLPRMASLLAGSGLILRDYFEPGGVGTPRVDQPWCLTVLDAPDLSLDAARQVLDTRLTQGLGRASTVVAQDTAALSTDPGIPWFDADCQDQAALQQEAATALPVPVSQVLGLLGGQPDPLAGAGTTVAVIDGGVNGQAVLGGSRGFLGLESDAAGRADVTDRFDCAGTPYPDGHGSNVAQIIRTLAPGAGLLALKACDDRGRCPTISVAKALLYLRNRYSGLPDISAVNMSFGGLPGSGDPVISAILRDMSSTLPNTLLLSAAGNVRDAAGHFPADRLREVNTLMPVAAAKRVSGQPGWALAGFNTWATWTTNNIRPLSAPGVRLALRVNNVDRELTGSSFATPVATAIAAREYLAGGTAVERAVILRREAQDLGTSLLIHSR